MAQVILYTAADSNYANQVAVLAGSIVRTQLASARLIILGSGWNERLRKPIQELQNGRFIIEFIDVDPKQFESVKLARKFPLATAYNILAPKYFLHGETRAIYLDADMVVTEDLQSLWNTPLKTPVGAVLDAHIVWVASPSMWRPWREENLQPLTPYLNTGMLLLNLERWREENLTEITLRFLEQYSLPCVDQDALNLALRGDFDQLHPRYNSMPYHHLKMLRYLDTVETDERIGEAITNPAIIHYHRSFFGKPWTYGCTHPGRDLWRTLADEVAPGWKKSFEPINTARAIAARYANMTTRDSRTTNYPSSLDAFKNERIV